MRRLIIFLLATLLIGGNGSYFLYPTVSDQLGQLRDAQTMKEYRAKASVMDSEKKNELFAEAETYNEALESIRPGDVFTAGTPRTSRDYQNHLNVHSGVIGELVIPGISLTLPIYHLCAETPATNYLVHLDGSSLPADGDGENIVLAGPGTIKSEGILGTIGLTDDWMLQDLDRMVPGDLMILNVLDRTMVYRVNEIQMLSSSGVTNLDLTPGETDRRLTIVTEREDRRLLVESERIPIAEARKALQEGDSTAKLENWKNVLLLGCPVMLVGLFIIWVIERIRRRSYRLPGQGRNAEKREKKSREKLKNLTTETSEGETK